MPTSGLHGKLFTALLILAAWPALTQQAEVRYSPMVENPWKVRHVAGGVTATNNGISLLPSFSLGRPALMFDLSVGNKKLSFDPQLRFAMDGKPWSFIFWWRYKVVKTEKFTFNVGAHPAFIFRPVQMMVGGVSREVMTSQRYLATEIVPNYWISKNTSIGIYYLHSGGLDPGTVNSTNFITVNANFNDIPLGKKYYLKFNPQVFYLKMDKPSGYYVTATITLSARNFPVSVQSIVNQAISTNIVTKSDFLWNLSLIYGFRHQYTKS